MRTLLAALALIALASTATPALAEPCEGSSCPVQQPDAPALPQTPEDCSGVNCALPTPVQKLLRDQLRQQWLLGSLIRH